MAIQYLSGQLAVTDPNPGGPTALSNIKADHMKIVKLTSANFTTTNTDTLVAVLPADAQIFRLSYYVKVALTGNSVATPNITIGTTSGGAELAASNAAPAGAAGVHSVISPAVGIMQNYDLPLGVDIRIYVRGGAATGNPTAGEQYLIIEYVR